MTPAQLRKRLESYANHGLKLKDIYHFRAGDFPGICEFEAGFNDSSLKDIFNGKVKTLNNLTLKCKSGSRIYDVMSVFVGATLVNDRVLEVLRAKGFKGWEPHRVRLWKQGITDTPYYVLRATTLLKHERITAANNPRGSDYRQYFDIRTWNGDDLFGFPGWREPFITRRVVDALTEAQITGWQADPITILDRMSDCEWHEDIIFAPLAKKKAAAAPTGKPYKPDCVGKPISSAVLEKKITASGLKKISGQIQAAAMPSLLFKTLPPTKGALAIGATRFGGEPDLPKGTPWPEKNGSPMMFLAQIRLRDVSTHMHDLPADGLLSFFSVAPDNEYAFVEGYGDWKVLYSPEKALLERLSSPTKLSRFASLEPRCVALHPQLSLPHPYEFKTPGLKDSYWDLRNSIVPSKGLKHRLLGYADLVQGCALSNAAKAASEEKVAQIKTKWRLLFQIDSDPSMCLNWGAGGRLYFVIPENDLSKAEFSRCWAVLQFT